MVEEESCFSHWRPVTQIAVRYINDLDDTVTEFACNTKICDKGDNEYGPLPLQDLGHRSGSNYNFEKTFAQIYGEEVLRRIWDKCQQMGLVNLPAWSAWTRRVAGPISVPYSSVNP